MNGRLKKRLMYVVVVIGTPIIIGALLITGAVIATDIFYDALESELGAVYQPIAKDIAVSLDWVEITPTSSLKAERRIQTLLLLIEDYKPDQLKSQGKRAIRLSDGTIVRPEIQIIDEYGNVYDFRYGFREGNLSSFYPNTRFPEGRTYTKIRIRSEKPFKCLEITWRDETMK